MTRFTVVRNTTSGQTEHLLIDNGVMDPYIVGRFDSVHQAYVVAERLAGSGDLGPAFDARLINEREPF